MQEGLGFDLSEIYGHGEIRPEYTRFPHFLYHLLRSKWTAFVPGDGRLGYIERGAVRGGFPADRRCSFQVSFS